jgi:hypothetical protein
MTLMFEPFLPVWLVAAIGVVAAAFAAFGLYRRQRGMILRTLALAALTLALVNPILVDEQREPLPTIVAIAADRSQSQDVGPRKAQTDNACDRRRKRRWFGNAIDAPVRQYRLGA